mgnify:CR=1 FL=1
MQQCEAGWTGSAALVGAGGTNWTTPRATGFVWAAWSRTTRNPSSEASGSRCLDSTTESFWNSS